MLGKQNRRSALAAALVLTLAGRRAAADPASLTGAYSEYEMLAITDAEATLGTHVDRAPEGKTIARIDFVRIDPVDRHDPLPLALDVVHTTSKAYVLRRALLTRVREGTPYRAVDVDESARNLRQLRQLSLVAIVPMASSRPDEVRLVVITKDVWSLYVDFDLAVTAGGLESLTLEPKETNIAGTHQVAIGRTILEPETVTVGAAYEIPRLDGRWLAVTVDANAVVERQSGTVEGGYGSARVQRPLFSSRTEWAWSLGTTFANRLRRRYVNAAVTTFDASDPLTGEIRSVPWIWRERSIVEDAKLTRSFGWATKNDLSVGASFSHYRYEVPFERAPDRDAAARFSRAAVPVGEDRVGPFVQWHGYRSDFLRTLDLASLGLQEDHRLGHDLWLRVYPVVRALGSTREVLGAYAAAAHGVALGDGVARAAIETTVETDYDRVTDASTKASLGIASPRFGPSFFAGRFVFAAIGLRRFANYLNAQSFLGGESLLRGYPTRFLVGSDLVATNLEYRTRSFNLSAVQVGAVGFFDAGDAFSGDRLDPKQSVGGGLRFVFPQIDRATLRIDVGFPVSSIPSTGDVPPVSVFAGFQQAIVLPTAGAGLVP